MGVHRGPLRKAVHRLKYFNDLGLAATFAVALAALVVENAWQPDVLVPVALASGRERARGFNQAAVLSRPLAWELGIPIKTRALQRRRETRTQIGLSAAERRENVADAFHANGRIVAGRQVLLVDDVMTSGATVDAASQALHLVGAKKVYVLTLSRAVFSSARPPF